MTSKRIYYLLKMIFLKLTILVLKTIQIIMMMYSQVVLELTLNCLLLDLYKD